MLSCKVWVVKSIVDSIESSLMPNHGLIRFRDGFLTLSWDSVGDCILNNSFELGLIKCLIMLLVHLVVLRSFDPLVNITLEVLLLHLFPSISEPLDGS